MLGLVLDQVKYETRCGKNIDHIASLVNLWSQRWTTVAAGALHSNPIYVC